MPRLKNRLPSYRLHKASGQAMVQVGGKRIYLGTYGTPESHEKYNATIAGWVAADRPAVVETEDKLAINEMVLQYVEFASTYYQKAGEPTSELHGIKQAVKVLCSLYGHTGADDFGPLKLKAARQKMIDMGWSRATINQAIGKIRRCVKWAVENEMVRPEVYQGLAAVTGLRKGRSEARESKPVEPVPDAVVQATLPHLPVIVADMVRLQRLAGMRPDEVCRVRPCDLDRSGDVWLYRPESHKTQHHGRERVVLIGPKGQEVLRPYLLRPVESFCFSPTDSERKRRAEQHEARTTPINHGNRPGTNRASKPKRTAGDQYTTASYRRAIHRACDLAFPPDTDLDGDELKQWQSDQRWSPNQLRHATGTEVRKQFGLEAAQVTLGHSKADVTQVYAERDLTKAIEVARKIG